LGWGIGVAVVMIVSVTALAIVLAVLLSNVVGVAFASWTFKIPRLSRRKSRDAGTR